MALVRSLRPVAETLVARVNGPSYVAARSFNVSAVARGGAGAPVTKGAAPVSELEETHELTWDDGTKYVEPCMDDPLPNYTRGDAAKMLAAGFGVYALFWQMAIWNDKPSKQPWVVRECQPLPARTA